MRGNLSTLETEWAQDLLRATSNTIWLYARYNLHLLCGLTDAQYLRPKHLLEVTFVIFDIERGQLTRRTDRNVFPHLSAIRVE